jgi:hypothetical protein
MASPAASERPAYGSLAPGEEPADGASPADLEVEDGATDFEPQDGGVRVSSGGTGDDRVDAALRRLDSIDELPIGEHVEQYDAVHRTLQDALAAIDEG